MGFRSFKITFALSLAACSTVSVSACSSDDEEPQGKAGTGAGAAGGAGGSNGRGGSSGTGAGGSSGTSAGGTGTGGTGGMGSITCGTKTCQPGGLGFIPACCIDNERCGIDPPQFTPEGEDLPCTEVEQPGTPDPTCFAGQGMGLDDAGLDADGIDGGRLTIPGCCRPNGMCGILISFPQLGLNLGCIEPRSYGAIFDAGPPQRCGDAGGSDSSTVDSSTVDSSTDDSSTGDSNTGD